MEGGQVPSPIKKDHGPSLEVISTVQRAILSRVSQAGTLSADMKPPMEDTLWWGEGAALGHTACPCKSAQNGSGLDQRSEAFAQAFLCT